MKAVRRTLVVLLAVLLAALLGFLYYKTQGVDFGGQLRVNDHLRVLRETDAKWNEAVLRAQSEMLGADNLAPAMPAQALRALQGLAEEARALDVPVLVASSASLQTLFDRKLALMQEYRERSAAFKASLREVLDATAMAQGQVRGGSPVPAARARTEELRLLVDGLPALALEFSSLSGEGPARDLGQAREALAALEPSMPDGLRESAAALGADLDALAAAKAPRDELFNRLYYFPTSPRTDSVGGDFARAFQDVLAERDLYRVYLIAYSAALLIFLGWIAAQLVRSYRVINDVNAQLKRANETLEQRVQERTRELSDAVKHLKESEAMLVQSEKMSSLGQMVAGVAHEINTPLAYVKSSLETVTSQLPQLQSMVQETESLLGALQGGEATESQVTNQFARVTAMAEGMREHEVLGTLQRLVDDGMYGIGQISELVANLKNFSRLDRNKVSRFDLREGLESTLQIARNLVKHKNIVREYGDIPLVSCSPSQINQVFLNLVSNAAQATPDTGGTIRLVTRRVGTDRVAVDVEDDGHGIPPEVLPRIFDPFFTTKDVGKGTGLGLSISYKIVDQHGGRIDVKSEVGKGTRFTVTLPVESALPEEAAA
jgi:signal transduction histidine kinase